MNHQIINLYKNENANNKNINLYTTKIFLELMKNLKNKIFFDVGCSYGFYSFLALSFGWETIAFEKNCEKYDVLCQNIKNNNWTSGIIPIYTKIGMNPSIDNFIKMDCPIGLIKINAGSDTPEVIEGMKYSIEHNLIDNLIITMYPQLKPANVWIEIIIYLQKHQFNRIYDISSSIIDPKEDCIKMHPYKINNIHSTSVVTILFMKQPI